MLLDTSGMLCCFDRGQASHADAVRQFHTAPVRITHSYVLAEFVALCQARHLNRVASLDFVAALANDPFVQTIWVDEARHRAALDLLRLRPDKSYSLCDAVSFEIMRLRDLSDALTTDHHFEQEGFRRILQP
jgi:uncharacterized protein